MRQLEGVCSSKIYHCHLSEVYYCIVVRRSCWGRSKVRMVKALVQLALGNKDGWGGRSVVGSVVVFL